jgi:hypothetical protein
MVGPMEDDGVATLKLGDVAKLCGVNAGVLRRLIDDGALAGSVRSTTGHVYLREDCVPTWHQVVEMLEAQFAVHVHKAQAAHARVQVEIEAVRNDLELALEAPYEVLGDDLTSFHSFPHDPRQSSLSSALFRMEVEVFAVAAYSQALRETRAAG